MMKNVNRREALKRTAYIMGGTLMAPTVAGVLNGCTPTPKLDWIPEFFSIEQAKLITTVVDVILPETDTPAASELGVPSFIEQIVSSIASPEDREKFMGTLITFEKECMDVTGKHFNELEEEQKVDFVNSQHVRMQQSEIDWKNKPFILSVKEMTIAGYCVTEVGATQLLQHVFIPGEYKACIPIEEAGNGKTWSM
ncbi:MAG: gluconate 2-dehydrogenase subunit 3 family protein [Cyclobacteriaceae bacterium]